MRFMLSMQTGNQGGLLPVDGTTAPIIAAFELVQSRAGTRSLAAGTLAAQLGADLVHATFQPLACRGARLLSPMARRGQPGRNQQQAEYRRAEDPASHGCSLRRWAAPARVESRPTT
jgi:hypothetical protein